MVTRTAAAAVMDGEIGRLCVGDRAMREAMAFRTAGVGASRGGTARIRAAFVYTMIALERDMIGIAMTNPNPR